MKKKALYSYLGLLIFLYAFIILAQFKNYTFSRDCFYYLGRGQDALSAPLSIFKPDYSFRFHPLYFLIAAQEFRFFGLNPMGYAWVALIVHITNSILVFSLARKIKIPEPAAFVSAVFFLFFSSQRGLIFDIANLVRLGAVLFLLLSSVFFMNFVNKTNIRHLIYALLFFSASFGFNEDAVSLPCLFLISYLIFRKKSTFLNFLFYLLPFFILSLSYSFFAYSIGSASNFNLKLGFGVPFQFLVFLKDLMHMLFIPRLEFISNHYIPAAALRILPFILIIIFAILILTIRQIYKISKSVPLFDSKTLLFALFWIITTAGVYALRPQGTTWQIRYLYLPGVGVALIFGVLSYNIWFSLELLSSQRHKKIASFMKSALFIIIFYILFLNIYTSIFMCQKVRMERKASLTIMCARDQKL